jgi:hypothetical protein
MNWISSFLSAPAISSTSSSTPCGVLVGVDALLAALERGDNEEAQKTMATFILFPASVVLKSRHLDGFAELLQQLDQRSPPNAAAQASLHMLMLSLGNHASPRYRGMVLRHKLLIR